MDKDEQQKLYDFMTDSKIDRALMHAKLDEILCEAKKTNGRVTKLEIVQSERKLWVYKTIALSLLVTSWLWIKESRDIVFGIIKTII